MTELVLPYPPSVNHYWRMWRGRMVISAEGRRYRGQVEHAMRGTQQLEGPLCIAITLFPPDRRRRDCDNTLKALFDAIGQGGGYHDDSQIVWLITIKADLVPGGRAVVRIWQRGSGIALARQTEDATRWLIGQPGSN